MDKVNKSPSTRLFVGGLPYRFTEGELLGLFAQFGRVVSLKIMHTPWGKSRGIGFVEFDNLDSAINAKTKLHNHKVGEDRTIIVDYAEPDPFHTAEGQARHQEAVAKKEARFARFPKARQSNFKNSSRVPLSSKGETDRRGGPRGISKPKFGSTRQSVYDSRTHHSSVGKKFSSRRRSK